MNRLFAPLNMALRLGLAALFLFAGLSKLAEPVGFAREIANYQFLPALAPHLAVVLPAAEIVAALGLLVPSSAYRRAAALLAAGLLASFSVAVISVVWRGVNIDCGCFGSGSGEISGLTVLRNVCLTAAALYLVFADRDEGSAASPPSDGLGDGVGAERARPG